MSPPLPRLPARGIGLRGLLAILAVAALASRAAGQDFTVRNYTEADGLPSSKVMEVRLAPSGLLWFATRAGLFEYDGTTWERRMTRSAGAGQEVRFVRFDEEGEPWTLTSDGVVLHERADGTHLRTSFSSVPRVGSLHDFDLLGAGDDAFLAVVSKPLGLFVREQGEWLQPESGEADATPIVVEAAFGRMYLGTSAGLRVIEGTRISSDFPGASELPRGPVAALTARRSVAGEELWVLGVGWAGVLDAAGRFELRFEELPRLAPHENFPVSLVVELGGGLLYANPWGMVLVDGRTGRGRIVDYHQGFIGCGANTLSTDADGLIWGATEIGAFKFLGSEVHVYRSAHGLLEDEVTAAAELPDGRIALGHFGGLTLLCDGITTPVEFEDPPPGLRSFGRVMDLHVDASGDLWVAGGGLGLGRLRDDDRVEWLSAPREVGAWVNAVREVEGGGLLVGSTQGLWRLRDGELEPVESGDLGRPFIRRIEVGRDGTVYLATMHGMGIGRNGSWRMLRSAPAHAAENQFYTVLENRNGRVWCGSSLGLYELVGSELVRAGPAYAVDRPVYSLVEDGRGRLWIGTDFGFQYSDGKRLCPLDWLAEYTGYEANRAAGFLDRRGRVWVGTTKGVAVFDREFEVPIRPPAVELLQLEIGSRPQALDHELTLDSGKSNLHFRVRALSFLVEDRLEFRSRVAGFTEWETDVGPTVLDKRYTGLPPGDYRFEVQARVPGGELSPVVRSPSIRVYGPIWTRAWFLAAGVAVTALLTVGLVRFVTHKRQALRLEVEVEERTRALETSLQELAKTDRLRALGLLAGGIAHDLRNVLTVLTGNLSLLRMDSPETSPFQEYFEATEKALERATQLSMQLQTFSTGGEPITRAIAIGDFVRDSADLVLSGSMVASELELEAGLWPAEADAAQIGQVFENLLLNARQCQPDGGWIRIEGRNRVVGEEADGLGVDPGRYVSFTIADGGPGITEEDRHRIFDPFFTTKDGGSGLGLATALSIVRRHGGSLDVDPPDGNAPEGRGAVFRVLLPASESPVARKVEPPAALPSPESRRVLVIDDDAHIRPLLVRMLERLGHRAEAARSCDEALALQARSLEEDRPFRMAVIDLTLPGDVSGPEILASLRERQPELVAVAISGHSEDSVLARPTDFGFDLALTKPFRLSDVARTLHELDRARTSPAD